MLVAVERHLDQLLGVGDDMKVVAAGTYNALPEEEQGPVRSNPDWSAWETVSRRTSAMPSPAQRASRTSGRNRVP